MMTDARAHEMGDASARAAAHTSAEAVIETAGGVVIRTVGTTEEVLVVHRPRYDDWSLPKGHLEPGEDAAAAALREVEEETGVHAAVAGPVGESCYEVDGRPKRVRWFAMRVVSGDPATREPDEEVDVARWVPGPDLGALLTHPTDLATVDAALDVVRTGPRPPR
jgi:8-oxo-dGTP pyrophosphatase MutT (NUDIX family)